MNYFSTLIHKHLIGHNLCFIFSNWECDPILYIYSSKHFQQFKNGSILKKVWSLEPCSIVLKHDMIFNSQNENLVKVLELIILHFLVLSHTSHLWEYAWISKHSPTCFLCHAPTLVIVTKTTTTNDFPQCTRIKTNCNKKKIISNSRSHNTIIKTKVQNMQRK